LTKLTKADVQSAPRFPKVLEKFKEFLVKNGLIDGVTGKRLKRFTW
jgi:3'-5' exoribonuclease 1